MATVIVQVWAGGGGGGQTTSSRASGGGGGGFAQLNALTVTSGTGYTVTVGGGGGIESAGGDSWFSSTGTVRATGGGPGSHGVNGTHLDGGTAGQGIVGDVLHNGGAGGNNDFNASASGGGGGAGSTANGTSADGTSAGGTTAGGAGGAGGGGNGGDGGSGSGASAGAGNTLGGGSGGARGNPSTGASGARGQVVVKALLGVISSATGGTHTTDATYDIWTFTADGTWTPTINTTLTISVSETTNVTESVSLAEIDSLSVSDTTNLSELVTAELVDVINVSDTTPITEAVTLNVPIRLSVSDTTNVTEVSSVKIPFLPVSASDTTAISEYFQLSLTATETADLPGSIVVSDYKWLTSTLKTAQNGPGFQPYYKCRIVDDTIQPNEIITPPAVPVNGSAATTPDGYVVAVGDDGTGKLGFWKLLDASTGWGTPTATLADPYRDDLNADVKVSEYFNGYYVIDVYYWYNSGSKLLIGHQRSLDSGATWSASIVVNDPGIVNNTTNNVYLSAAKPVWVPPTTGNSASISGMVFYLKRDTTGIQQYEIQYQYYNGYGLVYGAPFGWRSAGADPDSGDWVLHSFDNIYSNGSFFIVFAGYHKLLDHVPNSNYGLYVVRLDFDPTTAGSKDFWSTIKQLFASTANTITNFNSFTYPTINLIGSTYNVMFRANLVESTDTATTGVVGYVVTQTFYMLMQSKDLYNFSYPAPMIFPDGLYFFSSGAYDFIANGSYIYTIGGGLLWQYVVNSIVADVSDSIINYQISEMATAASQIVLNIANMNNQWVGPSPTKTGAAAIAKDRKIYLEQGYVTSAGNEIAPRNIFYIDDIKQKVDASNNIVTITARDYAKRLKVLTTKFVFNYDGPIAYADIFLGNTMGNWNIQQGNWGESDGAMVLESSSGIISLAAVTDNNESSLLSVVIKVSDSDGSNTSTVYPLYMDADNYVYFQIYVAAPNTLAYKFGVVVDGTDHVIVNNFWGELVSLHSGFLPIQIRKRQYTVYDVVIGSPFASANMPGTYDRSAYSGSVPGFPKTIDNSIAGLDVSPYFSTSQVVLQGSPAIGFDGVPVALFQYFKYFTFSDSLSIQDAVQRIGVLAGQQDYNVNNSFRDITFPAADYFGSFTFDGRMKIAPSSTIMNQVSALNNGELVVSGYVLPTDSASDYSLSLIFRADSAASLAQYYRLVISKTISNGLTKATFYINVGGTEYQMVSTSMDGYARGDGSGTNLPTNPMPLDITKPHVYKLVLIDQFFYIFVDNRLFLMWQDNNTQVNGTSFSNGYWGLKTDSNSTFVVSEIRSTLMWNQMPNASFNPGDDADNTVRGIAQMVKGFTFSDLMGRLNAKTLSGDDEGTFTYSDLIYSQSADNSDAVYVNQVTVYGNGVSAIARDSTSIATTGKVRELTISDYKIVTYKDALSRAEQELIDANRFNTQNTPIHPNNVGAEILDAITIENTGENSTDVDGDFRVYNQTVSNDGSRGRYALQLETGTL